MKVNPKSNSPERDKILEGMSKVYEKLIEEKRRINGTLVIWKNGKIVKIKP